MIITSDVEGLLQLEIPRRAAVVDELRVENEAIKIRRKAKQVEFAERASPASACRAIVVRFRAEDETDDTQTVVRSA